MQGTAISLADDHGKSFNKNPPNARNASNTISSRDSQCVPVPLSQSSRSELSGDESVLTNLIPGADACPKNSERRSWFVKI